MKAAGRPACATSLSTPPSRSEARGVGRVDPGWARKSAAPISPRGGGNPFGLEEGVQGRDRVELDQGPLVHGPGQSSGPPAGRFCRPGFFIGSFGKYLPAGMPAVLPRRFRGDLGGRRAGEKDSGHHEGHQVGLGAPPGNRPWPGTGKKRV